MKKSRASLRANMGHVTAKSLGKGDTCPGSPQPLPPQAISAGMLFPDPGQKGPQTIPKPTFPKRYHQSGPRKKQRKTRISEKSSKKYQHLRVEISTLTTEPADMVVP